MTLPLIIRIKATAFLIALTHANCLDGVEHSATETAPAF